MGYILIINYYSVTSGIEAYLWFIGGNECINSTLVLWCILETAGRCLTKASHMIKRKYITAITEIIDPTLATIFHLIRLSG